MPKKDSKSLWEILVPNYDNSGKKYDLDYHHKWDDEVRKLTGGLTILKTAKGQWINNDGTLFSEEMIPVRLYCTKSDISDIVDLTMQHYSQEAVLAYKVSSEVILRYNPKFINVIID